MQKVPTFFGQSWGGGEGGEGSPLILGKRRDVGDKQDKPGSVQFSAILLARGVCSQRSVRKLGPHVLELIMARRYSNPLLFLVRMPLSVRSTSVCFPQEGPCVWEMAPGHPPLPRLATRTRRAARQRLSRGKQSCSKDSQLLQQVVGEKRRSEPSRWMSQLLESIGRPFDRLFGQATGRDGVFINHSESTPKRFLNPKAGEQELVWKSQVRVTDCRPRGFRNLYFKDGEPYNADSGDGRSAPSATGRRSVSSKVKWI